MTKKYNGDHATYSVVTYICTVYMVIFAVVLFSQFRESVLAKISTSIYGYL